MSITSLVRNNTNINTYNTGNYAPLTSDTNGALYVNNASVTSGVDSLNSSTSNLSGSQEFTGDWSDVSGYHGITVLVDGTSAGTSDGTLYLEFSHDTSITNRSISVTVSDVSNAPPRTLGVVAKYFRVRYVNGTTAMTSFDMQTMFHTEQVHLVSRLDQNLAFNADVTNVRSVIMGQTDSGDLLNVPVDGEGHLEVALHSPRLPFGSIHTEKLTPVFQTDGVYGINEGQVITSSALTGGAGTENSSFFVNTGTASLAQGVIQSRRRLRYRPGQGVVGKFTALYTTPVTNSYQIAGLGHPEDGVYFGYRNAYYGGFGPDTADMLEFGILYVNRAYRHIEEFTVTTGSNTAANATITLNSASFSVPLSDNGSNVYRTAYEISQFNYTGWDSYQNQDKVVFVASSANPKSGLYDFDAGTTGATVTRETTRSGSAGNETFISQSQWNGDKMDGTGPSGITLDPTKGNVFRIGIQYLGFGAITFEVETSGDRNNSTFVKVHTIRSANSLTDTTFGNPSFPFTMAAYSAGSTTDLKVKCGSFAGFIEGDQVLRGNRFSYNAVKVNLSATGNNAFFTIQNNLVYKNVANQAVIKLVSISAAAKDATNGNPTNITLLRNADLTGNVKFDNYSERSVTSFDTTGSLATIEDNSQVVFSMPLSVQGSLVHTFDDEITIQPGETLSVVGNGLGGVIDEVAVTLNTREDQ